MKTSLSGISAGTERQRNGGGGFGCFWCVVLGWQVFHLIAIVANIFKCFYIYIYIYMHKNMYNSSDSHHDDVYIYKYTFYLFFIYI